MHRIFESMARRVLWLLLLCGACLSALRGAEARWGKGGAASRKAAEREEEDQRVCAAWPAVGHSGLVLGVV
ncbi:MAG: hypothetical protein AAFU61_18320, partial [Pseudomonadota bacterium]